MRLKLILPVVEVEKYTPPEECPYRCGGKEHRIRQEVKKRVYDTEHEEVRARRCECLACHRTFRVYPQGVSRKQLSQRVIGIAAMLYLLGLSYGAVVLMLEALGVWIGKTTVYEIVQDMAERVPGMKRADLSQEYRTSALGTDITSVKCNGNWLPLGVTVDALTGATLTIDHLSAEDAQALKEWLQPILEMVEAQVLVTDDADALKIVADESGVYHQVCKSHVGRNTDGLVEQMQNSLADDRFHPSLDRLGISTSQAVLDLVRLKELIHLRLPESHRELEALYLRYQEARASPKGNSASLAYRMRNLFLDRWNLWPRLTFYRIWKDPVSGQTLDGTNNASERSIGWRIKERYRTMRGYKREQSALNVSRLIAYCGNRLERGVELVTLMT